MQNALLAARVGAEIFPVKGGEDFRGISVLHSAVDDSLTDALLVGTEYMGDKYTDLFGMVHEKMPPSESNKLIFLYCKGRICILQFIIWISQDKVKVAKMALLILS